MSQASSSSATTPAVQCRQVDYASRQRLVLKHVDFEVAAGTTLGVIGPNGGGKTTLLRLLVGLIAPTRGEVRICGLEPAAATRRGTLIGYLPQLPQVETRLPLSVRQTVMLGLAGKTPLLQAHTREDQEAADELIEQVGLADCREEHIGALSGGQLQRVLIARALVCHPAVLIMDEPTTGIDALAQDRFVELIGELKRRLSLTIVFASHDLRAIGALCDRVACLNLSLHLHEQRASAERQAHDLLCHYASPNQG